MLYVGNSHATKVINHHSQGKKIKTDISIIINAKLFFTYTNLFFVNDKVRAESLKLGHTTLLPNIIEM